MFTLLAKFLAKPTAQNAERVRVYNLRHPMAESLLDRLELAVLNEALANGASRKAA